MTGFFDRMLGRGGKEGSGAIAKSRLEVVLVHDRINLSPERLRELKAELLAVIAKYVPIDVDSVDIAVEQPDRNSSRLVAQIPFGKGKILDLSSDDYTEDDDLDDSAPGLPDSPKEESHSLTTSENRNTVESDNSAPPDSPVDAAADTPPETNDSD